MDIEPERQVYRGHHAVTKVEQLDAHRWAVIYGGRIYGVDFLPEPWCSMSKEKRESEFAALERAREDGDTFMVEMLDHPIVRFYLAFPDPLDQFAHDPDDHAVQQILLSHIFAAAADVRVKSDDAVEEALAKLPRFTAMDLRKRRENNREGTNYAGTVFAVVAGHELIRTGKAHSATAAARMACEKIARTIANPLHRPAANTVRKYLPNPKTRS